MKLAPLVVGRRPVYLWLLAAVLVYSTTAIAADFAKERKKKYQKAMTPDALARCEARLKQLKPGQPLGDDAFGFKFFVLEDDGKVDYVGVADGWIPSMSGDISGALTNFGQYCGRDSSNVWGEHFFGYVWGDMTLVPKYRVLTRARLISPAEYSRREKEMSVGKLEGKSETLYFADPVFVESREIPGTDPAAAAKEEGATKRAVEAKDLAKLPEQLCSEPDYQQAQGVLDGLAAGTPMWDLPSRLGGVLFTLNYGQAYSLQMKGFLNTSAFGPWVVTRPEGKYEVWTFGTMSGGKETPQRSVVFRNGSLAEVKPFVPKDELAGTLHP